MAFSFVLALVFVFSIKPIDQVDWGGGGGLAEKGKDEQHGSFSTMYQMILYRDTGSIATVTKEFFCFRFGF